MSADGSIRTAEGTSRKRRRMSSDAGPPESATIDFDSRPGNSEGGKEKADEAAHTHTEPCHHEQTLRTLHGDLYAMRQLITCNICHRFMYEPYALSCGHTYCYSCLAEWMGKNHKKTCPDCRSVVKQEPTPAFLIREMVLIFVNRNQLLPDGETSEEHHQLAQEEAAIVAKDRADTDERQGGLFKGTFSRPQARGLRAVHDVSDHVDRCPGCMNEVEDGWCLTCDVRVRSSDADSDQSDDNATDHGEETDMSEELDLDIEAQDMARQFMGFQQYGRFPHGEESEDDSEDDEDYEDHDLSGFVEDEVRWDSDADEPDYSFEAVEFDDTPQAQRGGPIVVSDVSDSEDDDDEADIVQPVRRRLMNRRSAPSSARATVTISSGSEDDEEDDEEDDDEGPIPSNSQRVRRRPNQFIDVDNDVSAAPSDDESEGTTRPGAGGFSPLQYNFSPMHANSYAHSDSASASESNVDDESGPGDLQSADDRSTNDEQSDDEGEEDDVGMDGSDAEEDSDDSEHSTATGWDPQRHLVLFKQRLTTFPDTPIEPNPRHRLETLVARRNRFADPSPRTLPGASSRRSPVRLPRIPRRSSHGTAQHRAPAHPFNLGNTLARISAATREADPRAATYLDHRQTALGGVGLSNRSQRSPAGEPFRAAQRQAEYEGMNATDRNRRTGQRNRRSGPRILGSLREQRPPPSPSSGSSRTARDEDDTGTHLMGAVDDMSDDSNGW